MQPYLDPFAGSAIACSSGYMKITLIISKLSEKILWHYLNQLVTHSAYRQRCFLVTVVDSMIT